MNSTQLREAISEILRSADLTTITTKKVREILGTKFGSSGGEDFSDRKKEIDAIVMELINSGDKGQQHKNGNNSSSNKRSVDYEEEEEEEDTSTKKKAKTTGGGGGSGTGFTRTLKLSPELARLMGQPEMARHEVVKQMWKMIKEKNLYDPKNKQFAICNDEMFAVFGVKRFRTFGMMKYLKNHFRG